MLKAARSPRFLFILIGVLFIPVVLTNAVGTILSLASPTAHAADGRSDHSEVACTSSNHPPSFGGTVIIDANEVLCSQLLAFGGTIAVKGEVRGNIIAFNTRNGVMVNASFSATGNAIRGNSIFSNGSLGIDLANWRMI